MTAAYEIICVRKDSYRLDAEGLHPGAVATVNQIYDRSNISIGWRLNPLVTLQGSKSRLWPRREDAIASTRLMTAAKARRAISFCRTPTPPPRELRHDPARDRPPALQPKT